MIFESWSNFMRQQPLQSVHASTQYPLLKFINLPFFSSFNSVYRSKLHPSTICFWSYYFFFCLTNLEDCEPAVWRHLISCVCLLLCWATKDYIHYKLLIVFKEMCYWTGLHAGHVWFLFFLSDVLFLSDDSSMAFIYFIYGLLTFLGQQQKSDRTSQPPCNLYKLQFSCVEVHHHRLSLGLQWMRLCIPAGSWSAGILVRGEKKVFTIKEITSPFPGSLVCCLKPTVI